VPCFGAIHVRPPKERALLIQRVMLPTVRSRAVVIGAWLSASLAVALPSCAGRAVGPTGGPDPPLLSDGAFGGGFPAVEAATPDPAALDAPEADPGPVEEDAAEETPQTDSSHTRGVSPDGACTRPLAPGDLQIDELMIQSVAGTGDSGEWLEVRSTADCATNLNGLHGECPRGSKVVTFDVTTDVWIPPRGTFVVADSSDPAINHSLPGTLVIWSGHTGDVLRNQGSTLTLSRGGTLLDTITYPRLPLEVGVSVAFPACDAGDRQDFSRWKPSTASWFPGFLGTPNAPNTDIPCP
jgi:hypothetical protein